MREYEDGTRFTVTSGPESGMEQPAHAPRARMELDVTGLNGVGKLHERLVDEFRGRGGMPYGAADFAHVFVEHYTQEMDWQIARGGPTAGEIVRAAALGGPPEPDDAAVRRVRTLWRGAIERFTESEERAPESRARPAAGG